MDDFNSHNSAWAYNETNLSGDKLMEWIDTENLFLVHYDKDRVTFHLAR